MYGGGGIGGGVFGGGRIGGRGGEGILRGDVWEARVGGYWSVLVSEGV